MTGATWFGQGQASGSALISDHAVCVWVPLFALCCEELRRSELVSCPAALLSTADPHRLWQVSRAARRAGVRPHMTVSQAVGLCSNIKLCEPDPVYYDEQFSQLIVSLGDVSPVIEPTELGRVFVGVDGLGQLYGPAERQVEVIRRAMGNGKRPHRPQLNWERVARLGWGRGKFAAWVAATKAKPGEATVVADQDRTAFLATQPIGALPVDADTHRRLRQLGITTVGALAQLPEVAIVSQFGNEGRRLWLWAHGTFSDPVTGQETPEPIVAELEFPTPVIDRAALRHAIETLMEKALRHPRRTGWRVLQVRVRAQQEHGTSWSTCVILKNPSAQRDDIIAPIVARLDQAPPTGAVITLNVAFTDFVRGTDELQLFARDAASSARAGRRRALRKAVREIRSRFGTSLYHVIEVQPRSRILERRYALVDYEP